MGPYGPDYNVHLKFNHRNCGITHEDEIHVINPLTMKDSHIMQKYRLLIISYTAVRAKPNEFLSMIQYAS